MVNSTYSFYSIATDYVGNREIKSELAETTVNIGVDDITIYPNPAHDQLNIILPNASLTKKLSLFDIQGKTVVLDFSVNNNKVHSAFNKALESGFYILKIETANKSYYRKVIIN